MGNKQKDKSNILELLREVQDHRRKEGKRHPLEIVVLIIIMAIMSGAKTERAIARFAQNNKKELIKVLQIERKEVPTRYVFCNVIRNIDFNHLQSIFQKWAINMIPIEEKDFVSIDGKDLRGTIKNPQNSLQNFISIVSVFASKRKQVLGARKIENKKESEIPSVIELIKLLDLQDVTFTMDALHCREKTLNTIAKSGNHYIVSVKGNQKNLSEDIKKPKKPTNIR